MTRQHLLRTNYLTLDFSVEAVMVVRGGTRLRRRVPLWPLARMRLDSLTMTNRTRLLRMDF